MRSCLRFLFATVVLLAVPLSASAESKTVWDFRDTAIPGRWEVNENIEVNKIADGLQLHAKSDAAITQTELPSHRIDSVQLVIIATRPMEAKLVWHPDGEAPGALLQVPFSIVGSGSPETIGIDLGVYPQWSGHTDHLGILLPQNADIVLQSMTLQGWSGIGKIGEAWKSFWAFDHFLAYSINFLWGPLVTFNEVGRLTMYDTQPPRAVSANRYFYDALIIVALLLAAHRLFGGDNSYFDSPLFRKRAPHIFLFLCFFAGLWLFYDARMGLEYLSYAKDDYVSYISQPPGKRIFRNYQNFYDIADAALPELRQEKRYGLLLPHEGQFQSILRYETYPSVPVNIQDGNDMSDIRLWLAFRRPDITMNGSGQLVVNTVAISKPGTIVARYDESSFLFRVNP
ncbi:MAG: hypothetical protein JWM56_956 [Candidatus Peribacteria bacterium]|nr:hypothetical protein [Candidatus Peribacteria bacterium]